MKEDTFRWAATYKDGSVQYQVDPETGEKSAYKDIDRKNLVGFHMILVEANAPFMTIDFSDGDGEKLVWTRRIRAKEGGIVGRVYLVGKKGRFIILLHEDGSTQIVNNFREDNALLADVE